MGTGGGSLWMMLVWVRAAREEVMGLGFGYRRGDDWDETMGRDVKSTARKRLGHEYGKGWHCSLEFWVEQRSRGGGRGHTLPFCMIGRCILADQLICSLDIADELSQEMSLAVSPTRSSCDITVSKC
jgi:hypothetical protein